MNLELIKQTCLHGYGGTPVTEELGITICESKVDGATVGTGNKRMGVVLLAWLWDHILSMPLSKIKCKISIVFMYRLSFVHVIMANGCQHSRMKQAQVNLAVVRFLRFRFLDRFFLNVHPYLAKALKNTAFMYRKSSVEQHK